MRGGELGRGDSVVVANDGFGGREMFPSRRHSISGDRGGKRPDLGGSLSRIDGRDRRFELNEPASNRIQCLPGCSGKIVECSGRQEQAQRQAIERQRQQLDYEVQRAFEQYNEVDPRHRLVAAELERRWNTKLEELGAVTTALAVVEHQTRVLSEAERAALLRRTATLIEGRREELAELICREVGKAWKYSVGEVRDRGDDQHSPRLLQPERMRRLR